MSKKENDAIFFKSVFGGLIVGLMILGVIWGVYGFFPTPSAAEKYEDAYIAYNKELRICDDNRKDADKKKDCRLIAEKKHLKKALEFAKAGSPAALIGVSGVYADGGAGLLPDQKKSFRWMKAAADKGNIAALTMVGYRYAQGKGVERNLEKAEESFKAAAQLWETKKLSGKTVTVFIDQDGKIQNRFRETLKNGIMSFEAFNELMGHTAAWELLVLKSGAIPEDISRFKQSKEWSPWLYEAGDYKEQIKELKHKTNKDEAHKWLEIAFRGLSPVKANLKQGEFCAIAYALAGNKTGEARDIILKTFAKKGYFELEKDSDASEKTCEFWEKQKLALISPTQK